MRKRIQRIVRRTRLNPPRHNALMCRLQFSPRPALLPERLRRFLLSQRKPRPR